MPWFQPMKCTRDPSTWIPRPTGLCLDMGGGVTQLKLFTQHICTEHLLGAWTTANGSTQ